MAKVLSTTKWFLRSWPVLIPILLAGSHYLVNKNSGIDMRDINKTVSLVLQITGGFLILYSIDSNIWTIRKMSLFEMICSWIKAFPPTMSPVTLEIDNLVMKITGHSPKIRVSKSGTTIEEKIEKLQQQIVWMREDLSDEVNYIKKLIEVERRRVKVEISEIRTCVRNVDTKIDEVSVGGIEWQLFGVLLMIHGSVASYYT